MEMLLGIWAIVVGAIVFNGFAAGAVAALHVWRHKRSRGSTATAAAAIAGLAPVLVLAPAMLVGDEIARASMIGSIVGLGVVGGVTMAVSFPGALIMARKLDGSGETYRTFE